MGAKEEVMAAQAKWARSRNHLSLYAPDVESNLFQGLSAQALKGYQSGDGHELERNMMALHSSSALVVNFFDYWTNRVDRLPLLRALGVGSGGAASLDFERKFRTGLQRSPNIDIAITLETGYVVAIESKFTEWMQSSTQKPELRPAYFADSRERWREQGLSNCQQLAANLKNERFEHLDAAQLLKHALGLATECGPDGFCLYYLYYEWRGSPESREHRREIRHFQRCVGRELRFRSLTYQDIYRSLHSSLRDPRHRDYLGYLCDRYFPEMSIAW